VKPSSVSGIIEAENWPANLTGFSSRVIRHEIQDFGGSIRLARYRITAMAPASNAIVAGWKF
jgi:hypothetical protein